MAHHKSYHPYRRDNIERVRKEKEEARRKEESEDSRMMLAVSCHGCACWCDSIGRYEGFEVCVELEGVISEEITSR